MAWIVGNELQTRAGPAKARVGLLLVATAALTSAVFLHCAFAVTGAPPRWYARDGYVFGAMMTLLSWVVLPGDYAPFAGMPFVAMPNAVGWVTSIAWALLAASGLIVLLHAFVAQTGKARRQMGAMSAASACGLVCMSAYAIAALRLPMLPWPLLGLTLYPMFLVYGILRYEVLLAIARSRRALVWAMLVGISGVAMALVAEQAEDNPLLASLFLRRVSAMTRLSPDASAWLGQRDWPGTVGGLRAMVEAAATLATQVSDTIDVALLRFVAGTADDAAPPSAAPSGALAAAVADLETRMRRTESSPKPRGCSAFRGRDRSRRWRDLDWLGCDRRSGLDRYPINAINLAFTSASSAALTRPLRVALRARQSWLLTWSASTTLGGLPANSTSKG